MDVNELLFDHQLAKLHCQHASSREDRNTNRALVGRHAGRITAWRKAEGLPAKGWPRDERLTCQASS